MTTRILTKTKQDSSLSGEWAEVYRAPSASVGVIRLGHTRQEMIGSLAYRVYEHLFTYEYARSKETEIQAEFERLAAEWRRETAHLSSLSMIAENQAYQEIIGMGKEAIPLILRDLEKTQAQWFWALRSIARESPIRPEDRGDIEAMTKAWIDWGIQRRYIGKADPSFRRGEFDGSSP